MKSDSEDPLLDDIFSEGAGGSFRQALIENTLQAVRRRRRLKKAGHGLLVAAALIAAAPIIFRSTTPRVSDLKIVRTEPMPPSMIVRTRRDSVIEITSSNLACPVVETRENKIVLKEINDDRLLALTAGLPVALVRDGENQARLLFSGSPPEQESETPQ